jgi:hypothetical protein
MNRIEALTAVLQDPGRSQAEKEIAARALRATNGEIKESATVPYQELSDDSRAMLLALGKKHLREVSDSDFTKYAQHFGHAQKQELCKQWREWVCPDDDFLALIGMSRTGYWKTIRDNAKSDDVRLNAEVEIRK